MDQDKIKEALREIKYCVEQETKGMSDQDYAEVVKELWLMTARLREEQLKVFLHKLVNETH